MENEQKNTVLTSIQIKRFRGLNDVSLKPLKRINLITGKNDTGKTSILEALRILFGKGGPQGCGNLSKEFRGGFGTGDHTETFWNWIFLNKDLSVPVEIHATTKETPDFGILIYRQKRIGPSEFPKGIQNVTGMVPIGPFGAFHFGAVLQKQHIAEIFTGKPSDPNDDAKAYNRVILKKGKKKVEQLLRSIDDRVQSVEPIHAGENQAPLMYVDVGLKEMLPVRHMGQGFNRLLNIFSEVIAGTVNILLIDEIENGLHYSVQSLVWEGLFNAAKELDIQIFATTHSWECIEAADRAARKSGEYDLNLIRLDRVNDDIKATMIDENALQTAKELNWEMR